MPSSGSVIPHALVFEFHNSEDSSAILAVDPAKPVCDYEVGTVGPGFIRPYEIATWRNIDPQGRPAKYLVETPACYVAWDRSDSPDAGLGWTP